MKNPFCVFGLHKLRFQQKAVAFLDEACCNNKYKNGEILECKICGDEFFEYPSGARIDLKKNNKVKIIPTMPKNSIEEAREFRNKIDRAFLFGDFENSSSKS